MQIRAEKSMQEISVVHWENNSAVWRKKTGERKLRRNAMWPGAGKQCERVQLLKPGAIEQRKRANGASKRAIAMLISATIQFEKSRYTVAKSDYSPAKKRYIVAKSDYTPAKKRYQLPRKDYMVPKSDYSLSRK
ncbi:MAG: hypothetical protein JNM88_02140, partial [Chitinophagaceae bacterium]|nr:hypothetical protein [Chitinophagaceae bacterium]